jgi:protein-L-isoaspartate(D-aspartate) O-methyltransferase
VSIEARKIRLIMELRKAGVSDTKVLSAIERVPRELFVPPQMLDKAYDDVALPIELGQTISQPMIVALMTQALQVHDRMKVLEIGTGSGYQTAVLSKLCRRVYTIEVLKPLAETADQRLRSLNIYNFTGKVGDGSKGWPEQAPFERILVTAAAGTEPPQPLLDQLADGGMLIIPLGATPSSQYVERIRRRGDQFERERLWSVRFVPLVGASEIRNPDTHADRL